ncbi:MAG: inorganic phosphate transporter [Candidatus Merdivicinus sp.]
MAMYWNEFMDLLCSSPGLIVASVMIVILMFVNGWTDAPNAVACCISTRALPPRKAVRLAVVMNFFGVLAISVVSSTIAKSMIQLVDFGTGDALITLKAGMAAAVIWSMGSWVIRMPTSKSHALMAGMTGAGIALQNSWSGINAQEWGKVFYGVLISAVVGLGGGWILSKGIEWAAGGLDRRKAAPFLKGGQIAASAAVAFLHGAQDGQKYMGIMMLAIFLSQGKEPVSDISIPIWLMILASVAMALGTSMGGYRIIRTLGFDLVKMEVYHGFAADVAAAVSLFISTAAGYPVSTTHTKTTAIIGVGVSQGLRAVNWRMVREILWIWILTVPCCGVLGYFLAKFVFRLL